VVFINSSNVIGLVLYNITSNITGTLFLTLFGILLMALILFLAFRVPFEVGAVLSFPFLLVVLSYNASFLAITGAVMIYLGIIVAFNFPYK